ncbi:Rap guanine nucleotide exchange factor 5 [Microtus ochrogaster]|uniref:Rap guanine nucleotide exchange factor 5 n=1 Tax=Microtus ochrogaster TaxID=79684 RepID=A0A8J6GH63_MICOH|nr:Rap guanine nucleotide exchange factor 5 [Microtus ochrogaster]
MGSSRLRVFDPHLERKDSEALSGRRLPLPTFDVPYFKYIDEEDEEDEWGSRSQSSTEEDSVDSLLSDRYMVVSGTPEKILEHLLNDLHLAEVQHKETAFVCGIDANLRPHSTRKAVYPPLNHSLQMHRKKHQGEEEKSDVPCRKRKVLHLVSQWIALYKDWLHEDEHSKMFLKTIYRNVLDDVYEYPILEKELKEFQKILGMHRRHLKENWLQHRGTVAEPEEIFCHVYITEHSYVSVKSKVSSTAQEILKVVAEKLQRAEEDLALVAIMFSGEKHEFQPNDLAVSKSLEASGRIFVHRKDLADTLQELIYFTFSRQGSGEHTVNLSLLLQRCNEVQLWVATEILLCSQLGKRVQLLKKFIKIAAHCKAQQNLNSFFAIVMGLNTASVSRLSQTWEKIPGKFKKLFSELESLTKQMAVCQAPDEYTMRMRTTGREESDVEEVFVRSQKAETELMSKRRLNGLSWHLLGPFILHASLFLLLQSG